MSHTNIIYIAAAAIQIEPPDLNERHGQYRYAKDGTARREKGPFGSLGTEQTHAEW